MIFVCSNRVQHPLSIPLAYIQKKHQNKPYTPTDNHTQKKSKQAIRTYKYHSYGQFFFQYHLNTRLIFFNKFDPFTYPTRRVKNENANVWPGPEELWQKFFLQYHLNTRLIFSINLIPSHTLAGANFFFQYHLNTGPIFFNKFDPFTS